MAAADPQKITVGSSGGVEFEEMAADQPKEIVEISDGVEFEEMAADQQKEIVEISDGVEFEEMAADQQKEIVEISDGVELEEMTADKQKEIVEFEEMASDQLKKITLSSSDGVDFKGKAIDQSEQKKIITLISCEGVEFKAEEAVVMMSQTLKHAIDGSCSDSTCIPLPNVYAKTLFKVLEYCSWHVNAGTPEEESDAAKKLKLYDEACVDVGMNELYHLVIAANYLDIKDLLDLCCQKAADTIKQGKRPEVIRKIFGIKNDFTPEQEAEIREELPWLFK